MKININGDITIEDVEGIIKKIVDHLCDCDAIFEYTISQTVNFAENEEVVK